MVMKMLKSKKENLMTSHFGTLYTQQVLQAALDDSFIWLSVWSNCAIAVEVLQNKIIGSFGFA